MEEIQNSLSLQNSSSCKLDVYFLDYVPDSTNAPLFKIDHEYLFLRKKATSEPGEELKFQRSLSCLFVTKHEDKSGLLFSSVENICVSDLTDMQKLEIILRYIILSRITILLISSQPKNWDSYQYSLLNLSPILQLSFQLMIQQFSRAKCPFPESVKQFDTFNSIGIGWLYHGVFVTLSQRSQDSVSIQISQSFSKNPKTVGLLLNKDEADDFFRNKFPQLKLMFPHDADSRYFYLQSIS